MRHNQKAAVPRPGPTEKSAVVVFAQPLGVHIGRRGFAARILFGRLGALNMHYRSQLAPVLGLSCCLFPLPRSYPVQLVCRDIKIAVRQPRVCPAIGGGGRGPPARGRRVELCSWSATVSSISAAADSGEVSVSEIRKEQLFAAV